MYYSANQSYTTVMTDSQILAARMSLVRSKNSKAELITFRYLRRKQIYFQKHYSRAPGKPDIALPRRKKAVFIDGDFWHGRTHARTLELRGPDDYWTKKVERNMARDKIQIKELKNSGWQALRVWESDINRKRTREETLNKISIFLKK
jgi:DNA mismatch endonuclease (patch repair protein)